jgi:hypothetical protein
MAIEGELKDMSLIGVMQIACLERKRAGLFISRRGEEGAVYFDTGEIVHASVGHLLGEEAIYQLLTWTDGKFRMSDQVVIPTRSIGKNWNYLLMEGMKRMDEQARERALTAESRKVVSKADIQADQHLENDLILLLSNVEQLMARLIEKKSQKQSSITLQVLADMLNQTVVLSEGLQKANRSAVSLQKVLGEAADVYPMVRLLQIQDNRLSVEVILGFDNSAASLLGDRRPALRQICQGLILALELYFNLFESLFHTNDMRDQWNETYTVFIVDLKRTLSKIQF